MAHLVVSHNAFVATQRVTDFICRTELDPGGRLRAWQRRTIHDDNILTEVRRCAATGGGLCNFVIRQIDAAAVGGVAVERIPLPVNDCIWDASGAASEGHTVVVGEAGPRV